MDIWIIITAVTTILTLANIFQWFDRRSKNKALQSFLEATHDIAKRLSGLSERSAIQEKSADVCAVLNAAIVTVGGQDNKKEIGESKANVSLSKKLKK